MKIKELPNEEKPREKAKKYGIQTLSNVELLSILLRTGTKKKNVKELSMEVLEMLGGFDRLEDMRLSSLMKIKGLGEVKGITLLAALELGKRFTKEIPKEKIKIRNAKDVYENYHSFYFKETQEKFMVLFLNTKNEVICSKILFVGTNNQSLVHPRDIFKEAILNNASKILCIHNHPSGNSYPSKEDEKVTMRLKESGELMGIPLLDHVILGDVSYYSFKENEGVL